MAAPRPGSCRSPSPRAATTSARSPASSTPRIPQTTETDCAELSRRFGVEDQWPVLCEPFTQWVLEDNFADGRPPLEDAGVQLAAGRPFTRAAAVVACWARYAEGTDESGEPDEMDGALAPQLQAAAGRQGSHPEAFLEDNRAIFGWETTRGSPGCTARS